MRISDWSSDVCSSDLKIIAEPGIALDAITRQQATFTTRDLAMFVHRHSDGKDQFDSAMSAVKASPELVGLGQDGKGQERFTSREMIAVEQRLARAADRLAERGGPDRKSVVSGKSVSVRAALGGRGIIKKKKQTTHT